MGRELLPTRRVAPRKVRAGDIVLVLARSGSRRWLLVDYVVGFGRPYVWSGRWAFGGQWAIHVAHRDNQTYVVKHRDDAARDAERLALRDGARM